MTVQKTLKLLAFLCLCSYGMYGQQWHAGDTINTVQKDTARIDMFRGNTLNYTGRI